MRGGILAGVYAAKTLGSPVYAELRTAFDQAMQEQGMDAFGKERELARFIQTGVDTLERGGTASCGLAGRGTGPRGRRPALPMAAMPMAAMPPEAAPAGSSLDSYLPAFALALPLPAGFTCTSGYGWRQDPVAADGSEDFHTGKDLAAAEGTPVYAAADGTVRAAALGSSYGNYVRILHEAGDETLYAHMQYVFVRPGQQVRQGQQIGTVGQTGNVTGPHLHFELLHAGIRDHPTRGVCRRGIRRRWSGRPCACPCPFFYTLLLAVDATGIFRLGLLCALLHECGHIVVFIALTGRLPALEASFCGALFIHARCAASPGEGTASGSGGTRRQSAAGGGDARLDGRPGGVRILRALASAGPTCWSAGSICCLCRDWTAGIWRAACVSLCAGHWTTAVNRIYK